MTRKTPCIIFVILLFSGCRISKIKTNQYYYNPGYHWPNVILYQDSIFAFNYAAPNRLGYSGSPLYPEKYFITKGHWKLKKGVIILTSSADSLAHNIESSHSSINPLIRNPIDPNQSTIVFNDIWGDTIEINKIIVKTATTQTIIDSSKKQFNIKMTPGVIELIFHFKNYEYYPLENFLGKNMDYNITLQPTYSSVFFKNDSFKITQKKIIDLDRKIEFIK